MFKKIKTKLNIFKNVLPTSAFVFLLAMPASTNYQLKDYSFGSGGTSNATSTNYALNAIAGDVGGQKETSAAYGFGSGLIFSSQANVPTAPTFSNPSNYYNKLQIIINTAGNAVDTKYAIAISTDNFATVTKFVKADHTMGSTLLLADYQTYAAWGSGSGINIIGLASGTTYQVKIKAMQGKFTETGYGPTSSAATTNPTLSFGIDQNAINFGSLTADTVIDSPVNVTATFATNGETGGKVYVIGKNGGLLSPTKSFTIASTSADLSTPIAGFGAQIVSVAQSSGGPLAKVAPYDGTAANVGIVDTAVREIFSSANPIVGGSGVFLLKAKSLALTPAANDYSEELTMIASGSF
ncbi:MAG: hypothetical protein WCI36_04470 [bacterium]